MTIPISAVGVGTEEEARVLAVLRSGDLVQGAVVRELEAGFRELCSTEHAVAVSSGTTALVCALQSLGIGPGDEVITSPFTFVATLSAILATGATAKFADIRADFTIDADAVRAAVTERTRVVMPVHLYGWPSDMDAIGDVATEHGLSIVEDACQAHGATIGERPVGSFGLGCFSLYATKNVIAGEGGVITTDDADLAERLRLLRNHGMRERYQYEMIGGNHRMTDLHAAIAVPQLGRLPVTTARRRANADALSSGLEAVPGIVLPDQATVRVDTKGRRHVWHQYTIRVTESAALDRDDLAAALAERGIGTGIYYPRVVFDDECFRSRPDVAVTAVPNARRAASEVLSLPVHPGLGDAEVAKVVDAVRELLGA